MILHGALKSAFLAQVITDWMGSEGRLVSFGVRYREMDVPGDPLTCGGAVTSTDATAGTVSCKLWIENGEGKSTTTGDAVVALPARQA